MYSFVFFIIVLFVQNVTPKVYVIDLTEADSGADKIEIKELLKLFKESKEHFKEVKLDRDQSTANEDDCLSSPTNTEKMKCLEKYQRDKDDSNYYPEYHHEFYTQRPKRKIYSLYNYYGGLLKSKSNPFTDVTRQEFSQDYLDLGDLSRREPKCLQPDCLNSDFKRRLRARLTALNDDFYEPKYRRNSKARMIEDEETSSDSSEDDSSDSSEEDSRITRKGKKHRKPNRFQVVFNDDSSLESEEEPKKVKKTKRPSYSSESEEVVIKQQESSSESSEEVTEKPIKFKEKYAYLQGNKVFDSFRRRLEHFLPKRYHWDEDDMRHLGYYWFDGPKGKYS